MLCVVLTGKCDQRMQSRSAMTILDDWCKTSMQNAMYI